MLDVFLVQMDCGATREESFGKVRKLLANVQKGDRAQNGIIVLPEMFATGYIPKNPDDFAEDFSSRSAGTTAKFLGELADETGYAVMGAGIAAGNVLRNRSSLYLPGSETEYAGYDKCHPFFPELSQFAAGASASLFKINSTGAMDSATDEGLAERWNISSAICYDLRFPELFRDAVKRGAQLITVQAAWPAIRIGHWTTLLKARAIENQVYIAAVNGVSSDNVASLPLGGTSMIISPLGEVISMASGDKEEVIHASLDQASLRQYRRDFPVLKGIVQDGMI